MEPKDRERHDRGARSPVPRFDPERAEIHGFVFSQDAILAVNVALSTKRPLLVSGPPGSGKSSIAVAIARTLFASMYRVQMRSRSTVADLCYRFDEQRASQDKSFGRSATSPSRYIDPGVLWWAFDPESARHRGDSSAPSEFLAMDPGLAPNSSRPLAVVLLDGIDRTTDDFLLDLLEIMEAEEFVVRDIDVRVRTTERFVLFLLTSNGERELPGPLLRRCIRLNLPQPDPAQLSAIGRSHFPDVPEERLRKVTEMFWQAQISGRFDASVVTYLDILRAVEALGVDGREYQFDEIFRRVLQPSTSDTVTDVRVEELANSAAEPPLPLPLDRFRHEVSERNREEPSPARWPQKTAASDPRIFLSYRRDDSAAIVGRIYDRLADEYGNENIFKDVDSIPYGTDFIAYLDREVKKCNVFFAVIGPRWMGAGSDAGGRLGDPNDLVRIEIAAALRRDIPVVPILVDGAQMPSDNQLPDDIKKLARRHGISVRHDPDFHADMKRLLSRLLA